MGSSIQHLGALLQLDVNNGLQPLLFNSSHFGSVSNSPFYIKQKYAWNPHKFQLGYIFVRGSAPFPYISMGQQVNFRGRAASRLTGCPNATNINRKFNHSLTSCKLLCLLKMIVHQATVRQ